MNKYDNYTDTDTDDENIVNGVKPKKNFVPIKENLVTTEGISYDNLKNNILNFKKLLQCETCGKFYDNRMVGNTEISDGLICQHCFFFLCFENIESKKAGWTLEKYIKLCGPEHDIKQCERFANGCECHLCMYLFDMQNIKKKKDDDETIMRTITFSSSKKKTVFLKEKTIDL